ncbi:MAG TPA: hypothetical protein PKA32_00890 [Candidatus Gracilibacteria bacterium]|nr:hypothetical protein [Candidatus Gracilibacteria bacterium]
MKAFFITGAILFTVLILIVAFENIATPVNNFLFVFLPVGSPFFIVMGVAGLGIGAGIFYAGLVSTLLRGGDDEENGVDSLQ